MMTTLLSAFVLSIVLLFLIAMYRAVLTGNVYNAEREDWRRQVHEAQRVAIRNRQEVEALQAELAGLREVLELQRQDARIERAYAIVEGRRRHVIGGDHECTG